jgi:hypothetical protein
MGVMRASRRYWAAPVSSSHGQEKGVHGMAVGQTEGDVRGAAGGVDAQLLAQLADDREGLAAGGAHGADRHDQRIDHDIFLGDAVVGGAFDDLLGDGVAHFGIFGDAGLVIGDGNDSGAVLLHQRQHALHLLVLAGHRVHQRLALVDREAGFQRLDDGRVDGQRQIG